MANLRVSVVVPTLRRADTLASCLKTLAAQDYENCEFIVQNNGDDRATRSVVEAMNDSRFRHHATADVLPMSRNWEMALDHVTGDVVAFVGDDDGLYPDACSIAAMLFSDNANDLVSWRPHWYFWPSYPKPSRANTILAELDLTFAVEEVDSRRELRGVYRFLTPYANLPMVYNSFVRMSVIRAARERLGPYFMGWSPDVTSGLINAFMTERFLRLSRPLSVTGTSAHSTGYAVSVPRSGDRTREIEQRDFGALAPRAPELPDTNLLPVLIAKDLLAVKKVLPSESAGIDIDYRGLMQLIASAINEYPGAYPEVLDIIARIGGAHGVAMDEIAIPAESRADEVRQSRFSYRGDTRAGLALDGDRLGTSDIAGAVRLLAEISPRRADLDIRVRRNRIPTLDVGQPIVLRKGSNQAAALLDGWGEAESEGTWSVGRQCALRFKVPSRAGYELRLACSALLTEVHRHIDVAWRSGRSGGVWTFDYDRPPPRTDMIIGADAIDDDGHVTVSFEIAKPVAPIFLGLSPDMRTLGIFVSSLRMAADD
ncbi:MAG: glycosyltransferase family A protein [Xanthobacteraceae bacterium]|nr:glycosyltransferase family A protein [Xanthobacteraceae bacterium]